MNKTFLLLTLLLFSLPGYTTPSFTGEWHSDDDKGQAELLFSLDLQQKDRHTLTGNYCITTSTRMDCYDDDKTDNIIYGNINGQTATVSLGPSRKNAKGKAMLILNNDVLLWYMIKPVDTRVMLPVPVIQAFIKNSDAEELNNRYRRFILKNFVIMVVNHCGSFLTPCDKLSYTGIRKKDNQIITLTGKTTMDSATQQVNGAIFDNGNIRYQLWFAEPFRLQVSRSGTILLDSSEITVQK